MKFKIEITRGFDGESQKSDTVESREAAGAWIKKNAPDKKAIAPYWTYTMKRDGDAKHTVIDYGSYFYFGRLTPLEGEKPEETEDAGQARS